MVHCLLFNPSPTPPRGRGMFFVNSRLFPSGKRGKGFDSSFFIIMFYHSHSFRFLLASTIASVSSGRFGKKSMPVLASSSSMLMV